MPEHMVRAELDAEDLVTVLDEHVDVCGNFYLLWPSGRHMLPKLRVFLDFVAEGLQA
jgi:DNA-binding transcriptional LysR family regulator